MRCVSLLSLLFITSAFATNRNDPYKIVLISDEGSETRTNEFMAYLRTQPPFNTIAPEDLQITVRRAPPGAMNCRSPYMQDQNSQRLVTCDQGALRRIQRDERANFAVAITSTPPYYGGSGGQIPVATIGAPNHVVLHEMLHTWGAEDEYAYTSPQEVSRYCHPGERGPNIAWFRDTPPYASDSSARTIHAGQVPWMGRIPSSMPVTQLPSLGSPARPAGRGQQTIGLYPGAGCPERNGEKSWKPYATSIMNGHTDDFMYPVYADLVSARIRRDLGREPRLVAASTVVAPTPTSAQPVTVAPAAPQSNPEPQVENQRRNREVIIKAEPKFTKPEDKESDDESKTSEE